MSIKADHWIRRMAEQHNMIEPFSPDQVRYLPDGHKVISYGVSSYGYDIRCAAEFKIFTNVHSAIVDPKNFDSASFVDVEADVCIIPPNSFALARTVEYLRIPRNIMTLCLGKSTYARCFRGDTQVALRNGQTIRLETMAEQAAQGHQFEGYAIDQQGHIIPVALEQPRFIGRDALYAVQINHEERIYCTPDHEFLCADGTWLMADALRPGMQLMANQCEHYQPEQTVTARSEAIKPRLVTAITAMAGDHDVFCLTVPAAGNFALAAGCFVKNCGIIVNVTPLEPEWEGHITLEFSNTTPLPAKIYAHEGVAQLLFFEATQPCDQSYRDRNGKYQGQRGVTLPKS
jgi:deoxycytidine triphosphate deaminase